MGLISDEDLRRVKEATDIVALFSNSCEVKPRGRDYWCCCPVHNEKSPSCKIDSVRQTWHCFGCGEGGDAIEFLRKTEGLNFREAVVKLAEGAGIILQLDGVSTIPKSYKDRLKSACKDAALFYHNILTKDTGQEASSARSYLTGRKMGIDLAKRWSIGFAPGGSLLYAHLKSKGYSNKELIDANLCVGSENYSTLRDRFYKRIMFPIFNIAGENIAFGGRTIADDKAKYLNTSETPIFHKSHELFALDKAKASIASTGSAIIVEGYTDAIAMHEAGITNVVATLGTALTSQHIKILERHARKSIVCIFDGDNAGKRAAEKALQFITENSTPEAGFNRIDINVVILPENLDPADYLEKFGEGSMRQAIENSISIIDYGINCKLEGRDISTPESRNRAAIEALQILAPIKDSMLAKDYALIIAGKTGVRQEAALEQLAALKTTGARHSSQERTSYQSAKTRDIAQNHPQNQPQNQQQNHPQNRSKLEGELVNIVIGNTNLALTYLMDLHKIYWNDPDCRLMIEVLTEHLKREPNIAPNILVSYVAEMCPNAYSIIGQAQTSQENQNSTTIEFLINTLTIQDKEAKLKSIQQQIANNASPDSPEAMNLYKEAVEVQQEIIETRKKL